MNRVEITCTGTDFVSIDEIVDFQGKLKSRTADQIAAVIRSIEEFGFSFPFFLWNDAGTRWCLDGHGRLGALRFMRDEGWEVPKLPAVYIEAKDETEAKQKLLRMNSQYGQITVDGLLEFTTGIDVEWTELSLPSGFLEIGEEPEEDTHYTKKIEAPIYEPKREAPPVSELTDSGRQMELLREIEETDLDPEVRGFLLVATYRHLVFNYGKIADFYAQAPAEVQRLMERSGLVIVDFDQAIENGFVQLTEKALSLYASEASADE